MTIQLPTTQYVERSNLYMDLVTSLIEQTDQQKIAALYEANLKTMQDDVVTFGNALADVLATGEFKEADADISYGGTAITFSLRSKFGHWVVVTFNSDGKHEFFVGYDVSNIELYNLNVNTIIAALKSYNKLQVVTAVGEQLFSTYFQAQDTRENE